MRHNEKENKEINIRVIRFLANVNSCSNNDYFNFNGELMAIATKQMKCSICDIEIDNGMDYHNPLPLGKSGDVCCTYCNITKVIPERLKPHKTKIQQKWEDLAECIRMVQLSARQVVKEVEDKKFKQWYRKRYGL